MMRPSVMQVDALALRRIADGGAILGSGGGGNPYIGRLMAQQALKGGKVVPVVSLDEFGDDDFILPIAMMGAPAVMMEKFPSGHEIPALVSMMERLIGAKVSAILCIEAGGLNSTIPFAAAAYMDLPIVDGDAMGRAFPELQMVTFTLGGIGATPMAMFDDKGNGATFDTVSNKWTERLARRLDHRNGWVGHGRPLSGTGWPDPRSVDQGQPDDGASHGCSDGRTRVRCRPYSGRNL